MKPPKPRRGAEPSAKRHGRRGPGDRCPIFGRIKPLKAEAQERCRGETDPAGRYGSVALADAVTVKAVLRSGRGVRKKPAVRAGYRAVLRAEACLGAGCHGGSLRSLLRGGSPARLRGAPGSAFGLVLVNPGVGFGQRCVPLDAGGVVGASASVSSAAIFKLAEGVETPRAGGTRRRGGTLRPLAGALRRP